MIRCVAAFPPSDLIGNFRLLEVFPNAYHYSLYFLSINRIGKLSALCCCFPTKTQFHAIIPSVFFNFSPVSARLMDSAFGSWNRDGAEDSYGSKQKESLNDVKVNEIQPEPTTTVLDTFKCSELISWFKSEQVGHKLCKLCRNCVI